MAADLRRVYSSHVERIGYDAETQELHVVWSRGNGTVFAGVPADVSQRVLSAPSIGEALHAEVRGQYQGRPR
jgi:hypothetical protein